MEAQGTVISERRSVLDRSPLSRLPDQALQFGLASIAVGVLVLLGAFFATLIGQSSAAISHIGIFNFLFHNNWDVSQLSQGGACETGSHCTFGAWPMLLGTLVTSGIALLLGVPVAVGTALFLTERCPRRARAPLSVLVDLLAAVPSVVYGLWGFLILAPKLRGFQQFLADKLSFLPFWAATVAGPSYFLAGLILAIMILPIVSAISREVIATVPTEQKEAALALGATRWEMIRTAVLPYSRAGITGGAMLGLGRAIGETIAVAFVIGGSTSVGHSIFEQGQSLAGVIALQFGEAQSTPLYKSTLFAAGLLLFVLTLLVNLLARRYVVRAGRGLRIGGDAAPALAEVESQAAPA
ncbi:MAG: phosphate ABC transporter permease subunit PstC [Actinomycetota bacterium]|nr:phosphate ABC transporter permease subunit PstC [Actinomycetota bacterium]